MVKTAIQLLQYNRKGYLLVVDCGLAGKAASQNEGERMLRELLALDEAVASAVSFAGEDSLILVAGKQSVGGLRLNGYPFRSDKGVAVVGINSQGIPSLTWSTGPGTRAASAENADAARRQTSLQPCRPLSRSAWRKMESSRDPEEVRRGFKASRTTPRSFAWSPTICDRCALCRSRFPLGCRSFSKTSSCFRFPLLLRRLPPRALWLLRPGKLIRSRRRVAP